MSASDSITTIMSTELKTLSPDDNLLDVQNLMKEHNIRHVPILRGNELLGIISLTDINLVIKTLDHEQAHPENHAAALQTIKVEKVMTHQVFSLTTRATIASAGEIFAERAYSALPVFENGHLVGIVTTTDMIQYLIQNS